MREHYIETIKKLFSKIEKEDISIRYISAPKYKITVSAQDYKSAEAKLKEIENNLTNEIKKLDGTIEFKRKNE